MLPRKATATPFACRANGRSPLAFRRDPEREHAGRVWTVVARCSSVGLRGLDCCSRELAGPKRNSPSRCSGLATRLDLRGCGSERTVARGAGFLTRESGVTSTRTAASPRSLARSLQAPGPARAPYRRKRGTRPGRAGCLWHGASGSRPMHGLPPRDRIVRCRCSSVSIASRQAHAEPRPAALPDHPQRTAFEEPPAPPATLPSRHNGDSRASGRTADERDGGEELGRNGDHERGKAGREQALRKSSQNVHAGEPPATHAPVVAVVTPRSSARPGARCAMSAIVEVAVMIISEVPMASRIDRRARSRGWGRSGSRRRRQ